MEENNGRVTMARLEQTVLELSKYVVALGDQQEKTGDKIDRALHEYSERLRAAENQVGRHEERLTQQSKDIDDLSKRSNIIDVMVAVGATVGQVVIQAINSLR